MQEAELKDKGQGRPQAAYTSSRNLQFTDPLGATPEAHPRLVQTRAGGESLGTAESRRTRDRARALGEFGSLKHVAQHS